MGADQRFTLPGSKYANNPKEAKTINATWNVGRGETSITAIDPLGLFRGQNIWK